MSNSSPPTSVVAIAGASGFVGKRLSIELSRSHSVIGLSRSPVEASHNLRWRVCDLFSLKEAEQALQGADTAIYLVHSMMPHARLVQGKFEDFDVMIADNFARACKAVGVKRILYLGGIIPPGALSQHLASRLEVEQVLGSYGIKLAVVRAGLIVGPKGSSFAMMVNLVKRLPVMLCPAWTATLGQPSSLEDVLRVLVLLLEDPERNGVWDIGGTEQISYIDMMATVASELHLKRRFISVPFMTVGLSRFWVSLVTGFPRELVAPLIKSLRTPMLVGNKNLFNLYGIVPLDFRSCVRSGLKLRPGRDVIGNKKVFSREHFWACVCRFLGMDSRHQSNLVCSMQRLTLPTGCDVRWVAKEYGAWLVKFLFPFVRVETSNAGDLDFLIRPFVVLGPRMHILRLRYEPARSSDTRQLYSLREECCLELMHHNLVGSNFVNYLGGVKLWRQFSTSNHLCLGGFINLRKQLPIFGL